MVTGARVVRDDCLCVESSSVQSFSSVLLMNKGHNDSSSITVSVCVAGVYAAT